MSILTLEGVIEQGQIRLKTKVDLPDNTRVLVVIPDVQVAQAAHIYSPHLVAPEQAAGFIIEVGKDDAENDG